MIFTTDLLAYAFIISLLVFFLASDALTLAGEMSERNKEFQTQRKAYDASEYLLWKLAPVEENAVQHHEINQSAIDALKIDDPDCVSLKKEVHIDDLYLFLDNTALCNAAKTNKTIVKRIALCGGGPGEYVCILEVGA